MASCALPLLDPDIKYVGVSKLRDLNASKLRDAQDTTYVLQENDQPLAVILSYDRYLLIQQELSAVLNALEMLTNKHESDGVVAGLTDQAAGRTRSFTQIKAALRNKYGEIAEPTQGK